MIRIKTTAALAALMLLTSSCFTGVESTPPIKAPKPQLGQQAAVMGTFLDDVLPEPFKSWQPGKRFAVVDNRFSILLGASAPTTPLAGEWIEWKGSRRVPTITGDDAIELLFTTRSGEELVYRAGRTAPERDIPFLVQQSLVDTVTARLKGNTYYLTTNVWRDSTDAPVNGRKFIPITIDAVNAGNAGYPLRLDFTTLDGGSPSTGSLFITTGPVSGTRASRRFATMLSHDNPRLRYPDITDKAWNNIVNGTAAPGMTREEVTLAMGAPRDVDRHTDNGASGIITEAWIYPSGHIVVFEDGIVVK